jgi:uncharacterized membrane protein
MDALAALLAGLSAQRAEHSLFIAGTQLPLEARVGGIFGGIIIGLAYFVALGRARALRYPSGAARLILLAFVALLSLDGLNALLFDLALPHAYPPANWLRFATGLLTGYALAAFSLPSVAWALWSEGDQSAPLEQGLELFFGVCLVGLFCLVVLADIWFLLYPVALVLSAGVCAALAEVNICLLALVRRWQARTGAEAAKIVLLGMALGIPELLLLRAVRLALADPG